MQPTHQNNYRELRQLGGVLAFSILAIHFYYCCYAAFARWHLTYPLVDRLVANFTKVGPLSHRAGAKLTAFFFAALSLVGQAAGKSTPTKRIMIYMVLGGILYLGSDIAFWATADPRLIAVTYMAVTITGLFLLFMGAKSLAGALHWRFSQDVFNQYNESFPQEERWIKARMSCIYPPDTASEIRSAQA